MTDRSWKIRSAAEAVALVPSGATVLIDGSGGGVNEPDAVLRALRERFAAEGEPRGLRLVHPNGLGDGQGSGIDRLADPELTRAVVGGHWGWGTRMQALAENEQIEAYCLPQGTMSQLLREIAAGRPGVVTKVGLNTFVDPRLDGGRLNELAADALVEFVELAGDDWLLYRSFPIDVAILRGSVADEQGNVVCDDEGLVCEQLPAAQAAKNSGGIVIVQVKHAVRAETLDPRRVRIPSVLVDAVVVDPTQRLSMRIPSHPGLTGAGRTVSVAEPLPPGPRRVIARRAAGELRRGDVVNLGYGVADGVATTADEEGFADQVTFTVEQGHIGGVPMSGTDFGLALNPQASIDATAQFDWYDGGGLDVSFLSFAQIDERGRLNVSRFAGRTPGVGGFINIAHGARRLVFVGTLAAGGTTKKFVRAVEHISFDAGEASRSGKPITVVTERAVFRLVGGVLELIELAPGMDVENDVLALMDFAPRIAADLRPIPSYAFAEERSGMTLVDGALVR